MDQAAPENPVGLAIGAGIRPGQQPPRRQQAQAGANGKFLHERSSLHGTSLLAGIVLLLSKNIHPFQHAGYGNHGRLDGHHAYAHCRAAAMHAAPDRHEPGLIPSASGLDSNILGLGIQKHILRLNPFYIRSRFKQRPYNDLAAGSRVLIPSTSGLDSNPL
ncbi:hypothetical protein, partial [Methyloparacoccus murrellii]